MTGLDLLGWIVVGLLAGAISGWFVGLRSVQGCLPTIVVGILGGIVGGWLAREPSRLPRLSRPHRPRELHPASPAS